MPTLKGQARLTYASDCIPPGSVTNNLQMCIHPFDTVASVPNPRWSCQARFGTRDNGGEGGIRTPETLARLTVFQDRRIRPLCHLSVSIKWPPTYKNHRLIIGQSNICHVILKAYGTRSRELLYRGRTKPNRPVSPNRNRCLLDLSRLRTSITCAGNLSPCPRGVRQGVV